MLLFVFSYLQMEDTSDGSDCELDISEALNHEFSPSNSLIGRYDPRGKHSNLKYIHYMPQLSWPMTGIDLEMAVSRFYLVNYMFNGNNEYQRIGNHVTNQWLDLNAVIFHSPTFLSNNDQFQDYFARISLYYTTTPIDSLTDAQKSDYFTGVPYNFLGAAAWNEYLAVPSIQYWTVGPSNNTRTASNYLTLYDETFTLDSLYKSTQFSVFFGTHKPLFISKRISLKGLRSYYQPLPTSMPVSGQIWVVIRALQSSSANSSNDMFKTQFACRLAFTDN